MKAGIRLILITLLLTSFGCNESATKKNSPSQTTTNPVTSTPEPDNVGPTGSVDPVDPDGVGAVDPVGYYPDEDPDDSSVLPGTATNKCGVIYKQPNNPVIFFQENGSLFMVQEFSYDSVVFLRSLRFPNDSFSVCIDGYVNGSNLFVNTTSSQVATTNPSKLFQNGEYAHEHCGSIAYVRNFSGVTSLNLKLGNTYYELKPPAGVMVPAGVPTTTSSITDDNSIEGCVYSNKASFYNYNVSFKPQFEVQAFDIGALNQ
jgi:hypothetical protein